MTEFIPKRQTAKNNSLTRIPLEVLLRSLNREGMKVVLRSILWMEKLREQIHAYAYEHFYSCTVFQKEQKVNGK